MNYLAVDLGAESGRVMIGTIHDDKLILRQAHRFANGPVEENGSLKWDFEKLMGQIKAGLKMAIAECKGDVAGIGVDSWGVDFGLLDKNGRLLEKPYHYRDSRTNGMIEKACELMGRRALYDNSGIQFLPFNSVYQLLAMRTAGDPALEKADKLMFIADLVAYHLCGQVFAEYSLASTSQIMDMRTGRWSQAILEALDLPEHLLPAILPTGTVLAKLTEATAKELGCEPIPVIATGSHDTACAVAGVPARKDTDWAYLSSGTWSLMGIETPNAVINDTTYEFMFTNEGGVGNTIRLLKNIMGLWLVQECRRQWQREGDTLDYAQLTELAKKANPFVAKIDPDYGDFLAPGDMPEKINRYLESTGQQRIDDKGQMVRVILESLARRYRQTLKQLEELKGGPIDVLHMVGGGIQNELLNQLTADATGCTVIAGPVEATAGGNILVQAMASGQIPSLQAAREVMANSVEMKTYKPDNTEAWM
ncbi:MAG TPA: rhamnulokinase [Phycisphaerales bacterium]|nr:rhamnulokinase [Phycisphaerales bacterium]